MSVDHIISTVAEQGFLLWRDGANIKFKGSREMSPEMIDLLRQQKLELLAYMKLRDIAGEMDWQLTDSLDWYKSDMTEVASTDMGRLRLIVQDYIKNIDLCRCEGYLPPRDSTPEPEPVKCSDCQNFIPDPIGGG